MSETHTHTHTHTHSVYDAGGEIGWFPCQYVERRGAAAARNSLKSCSPGGSDVGAVVVSDPSVNCIEAVVRPECDLPLHAMLSQVSVPSAAEPAAASGDDIEAEVAELVTAMRKSQSPVTGDPILPSHSGSSSGSFMSSRPSSNSRGSIDRALLLSVVGPACSVSQTAHANSPPL
jgi:hypothetical protein